MSSTLPRSRSLSSGAASVSSPSLALTARDRVRPVSLCESSWGRVLGPSGYQPARALQRSPSQANNLSTTVPCSLVTKSLGGRHTPTRSSLRHSRMVNRAVKGPLVQRWSSQPSPRGGLGRVGALVITAQTLLGLLTGGLAAWCLKWAPNSIAFSEVPHYAAIPVFVSGFLGAVLLACCSSRRRRTAANILKCLIVLASCVAIITCLCVCIFTALHLVYLTPMKCRPQKDVLTHVLSTASPELPTTFQSPLSGTFPVNNVNNDSEPVGNNRTAVPTVTESTSEPAWLSSPEASNIDIDNKLDIEGSEPASSTEDFSGYGFLDSSTDVSSTKKSPGFRSRNKTVTRDEINSDDEDEEDLIFDEGSGDGNLSEQDYITENLELQPVTSDLLPLNYEMPIRVEVEYCVCESWQGHWKRSFRYPDLSCLEVNRVLPVLSVATCIVTAGGAVLSGVLIYLLWASKNTFYQPVRTTEVRPIIFSSNLKRSHSVHCRTNGVPMVVNGGGYSNRNGGNFNSSNGNSAYFVNNYK